MNRAAKAQRVAVTALQAIAALSGLAGSFRHGMAAIVASGLVCWLLGLARPPDDSPK